MFCLFLKVRYLNTLSPYFSEMAPEVKFKRISGKISYSGVFKKSVRGKMCVFYRYLTLVPGKIS